MGRFGFIAGFSRRIKLLAFGSGSEMFLSDPELPAGYSRKSNNRI